MISKKIFIAFVLVQACFLLQAQKKDTIPNLSKGNYVITNLDEDTLSLLDEASQTLRALRNGAVIVRLKTSPKSVAAYRAAGKNDIADRIEADRRKQNEKIYQAFVRHFLFCKVFFIYSHDTKAFQEGNRAVLLNSDLQHDSTITFKGDNYVFCEYGSAQAFSEFQNQPFYWGASGSVRSTPILDTLPVQTSTAPATSSGIFFSDKNLKQLQRPFPYVEGVYMENYDAPVSSLNKQIERTYFRLVEKKDFKEKLKTEKKRLKAEHKKQPKYNPFK